MTALLGDARRGEALVRIWRCALLGLIVAVIGSRSALAGTLVSLNFTGFGSVQIDLFDDLVPETVNNFVDRYVATGRFDDSMVHRVDVGLGVIQGGGFTDQAEPIATAADPLIPLQYARANTRGTVAMARSANIDSATSQWFINTDDNTTALGPSNGGGYTVFGWVVGPGMGVVDSIAGVPTFPYSDPFGQVPLQGFTQADFDNDEDPLPHVVQLASATVVKTHPSYQNPFLSTDVNNDGFVKANDALAIISSLLTEGTHTLSSPFPGTNYFDTDGNGKLGAPDALQVISTLLTTPSAAQPLTTALFEPQLSPLVVVPEPPSLVLGAPVLLAVAGYLVLRGRIRRRSARLLD